jgi:hypothetical protein
MGANMNENGKPPPPPDLGQFHENWIAFPREERLRYAGQYVGWSPDGLRIVASAETEQAMEEKLIAMGIHPSQVVGEHIPPAEVVLF